MAQTNISIRVDEDIKREAETLCSKIGLTLSAATNVFYRQLIRTQGIPFHISAVEPKPMDENEAGRLPNQKEAVNRFIKNINAAETLPDDEFDGILNSRINITRSLEL